MAENGKYQQNIIFNFLEKLSKAPEKLICQENHYKED
jgi:hypothetical protein